MKTWLRYLLASVKIQQNRYTEVVEDRVLAQAETIKERRDNLFEQTIELTGGRNFAAFKEPL